MTIHVFYPTNTDITANIRVGALTGITTAADRGAVGQGQILIDDVSGALTINPFTGIGITESQCPGNTVTFFGYTNQRDVARIPGEDPTSVARRWTVGIMDVNAFLGLSAIYENSAKRPAETDLARIAWLLGNVTTHVHDTGYVATTGAVNMSAADYRGQFPIDVIADCGSISGRNYFAFFDQATSLTSLFYHANTDAILTSSLQISNVAGDADNVTTFAPLADATLTKDPSNVYTEVDLRYSGGLVKAFSPDTHDINRSVIAPELNTTSRTVAQARANQYLAQFATEVDTITCTIQVPIDKVNLLNAGHRVLVKFSHLTGYTSYTYMRVTQRLLSQDPASPQKYTLTLTLSNPVVARGSTGNAPTNTVNPPSNTAPFQPAAGGAFTYVQSAKTTSVLGEAIFTNPPAAGNFLVAISEIQQPGSGGTTSADYTPTYPSGWVLDMPSTGASFSVDPRVMAISIAHKVSVGAADQTVDVTWSLSGGAPGNLGFVVIAEYTGSGTLSDSNGGTFTSASSTAPIPATTPTANAPALIVAAAAHDPNYGGSIGAPWTIRQAYNTGGSRQELAYIDQIIATASGSYTGTFSGGGPPTDNYYWIPVVAYSASAANEPGVSQPVNTEPSNTSTGSGQSSFTTQYAYASNSLVVYVDGIWQHVTETNPHAGTWALSFVPRKSEVIDVRYQGE